ncbi:MAG: NAD(P)/FAD-dependent oxidoreductase [Pseudonocardiaceae bacterium]|nr:NAD(P)/FAD-dependent oxidoreductase [Pseudonocardiaceae bacterium]
MEHVVVVGGSVAGMRMLSGLRRAGFEGAITVVDPEAASPYDRPPLSKQVLLGTWEPEKASLGDPAGEWNARVIGERAVSLDVDTHEVGLASGACLRYDKLVIATGAAPRTLPGSGYDGVHVLRTMTDCLAVRRSLGRGGPLVVVGGGFIGAEVASSAKALGVPVTLVEALPAPMSHVLGEQVGALLTELHERNGVRVRCGVGVRGVEGSGGVEGGGRVQAVTLADGTRVPADTVVVGIGVIPDTGWLDASGIRLDDGVVCDEYCAAVGPEDVYAIGDVARWFDSRAGRYVRVEHWTNATEQANTVAHNLTRPAERRPHIGRPYFWSDQHGVKIQLAGHVAADDPVTILRDEGPKERVAAIYHDGDQLRAGLTISWPRALAEVRRALEGGLPAGDVLRSLADLSEQPRVVHS